MDVCYNPTGIGDVLIIPVKQGNRDEITQTTNGPITKITSLDGELIGYNIFAANEHLNLQQEGKFALTEELLGQIRNLFQQQGLSDSLDFDLSPKFVVGYVEAKELHENADKLSVCQVNAGEEAPLQIVCGAPNVEKGQKVVVAKVGAVMPSGMIIQPTELRGVPSNGMICSQKELGLPDAPKEKGIYVLDDSYTAGEAFNF
ncbi:YtpR family tRNA-binding protein [Lentibacillus sediminis]|uniref:YtpR family tRNA-binding protein n=1 Tax=Lentibacillus sediminis TaxID=1940529 RepID=UPI000C1C1C21|nr:DUF4479 domain-containing protein [Lentibacillus sediminis]